MPRKPSDIREAIVNTAATIAADKGWRAVSPSSICQELGIGRAAFDHHFDSRTSIAVALVRKLTAEAQDLAQFDRGDTPRDRLFEMLMARFDVAAPYKPAIAAILRAAPLDAELSLSLSFALERAMARMLDAAGIGCRGLKGLIRIKGLAVIYASSVRVWLRDESPDIAKTMAHLDKSLGTAERIVTGLGDLMRPRERAPRREEAAETESKPEKLPPKEKPAPKPGKGKARDVKTKSKPGKPKAKKTAEKARAKAKDKSRDKKKP